MVMNVIEKNKREKETGRIEVCVVISDKVIRDSLTKKVISE